MNQGKNRREQEDRTQCPLKRMETWFILIGEDRLEKLEDKIAVYSYQRKESGTDGRTRTRYGGKLACD